MYNRIINGYTIKEKLGEGGMAEVWYAENSIGKSSAIKFLKQKYCADEITVERFRNEAKVMQKLSHPNIRQVYDYGLDGNTPFIIMEYLDGDDLKNRMNNGEHFTSKRLQLWWNQLSDALNHTHRVGVIHRDIKPSNIFIDKYDNVKLLDFGIAKIEETGGHTQTGVAMGTRIYMSPEQVRDPKRVKSATDSYSLAVTFVHLLTGKAPYDTTTTSDYDIQISIVQRPLDTSTLPAEWKNFLQPYLLKNPQKRPSLSHFTNVVTNKSQSSFESNPYNDSYSDNTYVEAGVITEKKERSISSLPLERVFSYKGASFTMKLVEGGTFEMGATSHFWNDVREIESPPHYVEVSSFYMGETLVTQALWKAIMGDNPSSIKGDELPVHNVTHNDCLDFLDKLSKMTNLKFRLPTEAEWEYAAKGGKFHSGFKYSGSDDINTVAWYHKNSGDRLHEVKRKRPNALGLYDMSGNIQEWCSDWYGLYDPKPTKSMESVQKWANAWLSGVSAKDPQGPPRGKYRVCRGGVAGDSAKGCRVTARSGSTPEGKGKGVGLRIVLAL